ncbi:RNA polymerase, sigma 54 subunit, RpoN/SigL [Formivibrio citricus]|uniref:RNA polymerase sigma-54 factor n=1 Tax=Formivibrio citricus TaxID=83765 RepID=A0A1I4XQ61_9NEIS|nr:RNA polymerase factor sigma-54 [Formivibrio citricus]SFN28004.1 RNA polymerase, sigma 54 subunit, RpoN/SigL [Formivibrio citricus]
MKQSLQLRMAQQLNLTPQLAQSIKLLQLSTLDFQQEIERYLAENPLLEREEAGGDSETVSEDVAPQEREPEAETGELRWDEARGSGGRGDDDETDPALRVAKNDTLREYLLSQAGLLQLTARDRALLELLIDALDDDGFLTQSLEEILLQLPEDLRVELEIDEDDLQIALQHLQQLEPCGVAARDLAECLLLQLRALPDMPAKPLAEEIVRNGLDLLAARDYTKIKRQLHCDDEGLKAAQSLITGLNPHPGANWSADSPRYIVPDVIVDYYRGAWRVRLNEAAMPKIRVNEMYARILQQESASGMATQLQEARWLLKSVEQRGHTILRVAQAILERQKAFFEHGDVGMRPLVLRDIAEQLELHESTISRVTTQKFMLTPRGLLEFKYFFGSHVETEAGGECSATAIKALIRKLVQEEDKKKPYSDSAIGEELARQGIVIARRTVAKYREALMIPPVNQRKSL